MVENCLGLNVRKLGSSLSVKMKTSPIFIWIISSVYLKIQAHWVTWMRGFSDAVRRPGQKVDGRRLRSLDSGSLHNRDGGREHLKGKKQH